MNQRYENDEESCNMQNKNGTFDFGEMSGQEGIEQYRGENKGV